MRRNHELENELAEKIVGYVIVATDDFFAAKKELAQQHLTQQGSEPTEILRDCLHCGDFVSNDCEGNQDLIGCEQWRKTSAVA